MKPKLIAIFCFLIALPAGSFASASAYEELPECIVEDCKGGTWQKAAIHWRIRKTDDDTVLEYGPGLSWNDQSRMNETLRICNRYYLQRVCSSCNVRSLPYTMPACRD